MSLKDGRVESGLLAAEDGQSITLKTENAALKVIPKKDIEEMTEQAKSLMPEGLDKNLTVQNFRDVVRYVMADPFVTEVAVAGPWPASSAPAIDPRAGAPAERHWTRPVVGVPGRIPLPSGKGGTEQVAYVAAELTAPVDMDARLLLGAGCRVAVWLNGVACYDGVPARGPTAPDQVSAPVRLKAGANRMLIRATYPAGTAQGLYVRFHDPLRKLRYPEPRD